MPKPINLDPDVLIRPPRRKKRKKRKTDYIEYLQAPVIPDVQCPHTKKAVDASSCSLCLGAKPSIIVKPPVIDWWTVEETVDEIIDLDVDLLVGDE